MLPSSIMTFMSFTQQPSTPLSYVYCTRSLAAPFLSLALHLRWSERPCAFFSLSPLRDPPASFTRPLALSRAPSALSLLLFLDILTLPKLLPISGNPYPIGIQLTPTS